MLTQDTKVWVTGGSGFLGKSIIPKLLVKGVRSGNILASGSEINLLSLEEIEFTLSRFKPDVVIHAAALCGGIGINREKPAEMFYKNAMMGIQLMHSCYIHGVSKFVALGTICLYPKFTQVPFKEDTIWDGYPEETNAPYGLAKKMLLVQAQAYRQQYGFNAIYLIPVNLMGPGDNFNTKSSHVIPAMIRKFSEAVSLGDSKVVLWGDGTPTREFLYVKDAANGIVEATDKYDGDIPVNLGAGYEISMKSLADKISRMCGFTGTIEWDTSKPNGQPRRCLDVSRAKELFGWEATVDIDTGLRDTYEWFMENQKQP